jgi:hypothetical protein
MYYTFVSGLLRPLFYSFGLEGTFLEWAGPCVIATLPPLVSWKHKGVNRVRAAILDNRWTGKNRGYSVLTCLRRFFTDSLTLEPHLFEEFVKGLRLDDAAELILIIPDNTHAINDHIPNEPASILLH